MSGHDDESQSTTTTNISPSSLFSMKSATTRNDLSRLINKRTTTILQHDQMYTSFLHEHYSFIIAMISIKGGGYHWICLVPTPFNRTVGVFSSYGLNVTHNSYYDVRQIIPPSFNVVDISLLEDEFTYDGFQSPGSNVCGEYCINFSQLAGGSMQGMYKLGFKNANSVDLLKNNQPSSISEDNDKLAIKNFDWLSRWMKQTAQDEDTSPIPPPVEPSMELHLLLNNNNNSDEDKTKTQ